MKMSFLDDLKAIKERDPAARSNLEVFLLYPGVHALISHRAAHWFYKRDMKFTARLISQASRFITGIEIHPGAKIGKGLFIDHGSGVVIGETTEIGDQCTIYQGATLGGTGKHKGKRHPSLGNNVMVGSGAKILGPFKVGNNAKIAANSVVLKEVPDNATAVGSPAQIVKINGKRVVSDLDQVNIPDPVMQELDSLKERIKMIEDELDKIKKQTCCCENEVSDENI